MLYERWRQIAGTYPDELALRELSSGRQWTFRELALHLSESTYYADALGDLS